MVINKTQGMIQKKIVAQLFLEGGSATTDKLLESLDMSRVSLHSACFHLINRKLITKEINWRGGNPKGQFRPHKITTFSLTTIPVHRYRVNKILEEFRNLNSDFPIRVE